MNNVKTTPQYICPICHSLLLQEKKTFVCINNHCFDIAKEGYVNLLPVQQKKSKQPGDNKIMIQCRQDFLNQHYYDVLIEPCAKIIDKLITKRFDSCVLLDIGCGDGFFTRKIFQQLKQSTVCYGMDISKEAIKASAKKEKSIAWAVASYNNIPLQDNSIDIILKINAPLNYQKTRDKLSEDGVVISITPGEKHLNGLKSIIYEQAQLHEKEVCPGTYNELHSETVAHEITIDNETDIKNLFMMTPFFWNASQNSKNKIDDLRQLSSDIAFDIHVWGKQ